VPTGEIVGLLDPALQLRHDPSLARKGDGRSEIGPYIERCARIEAAFGRDLVKGRGSSMNRKLLLALAAFIGVAATIAATAVAGGGGSAATIPVRSTTGDTMGFTAEGGATPLADAKTVDHWSG
jgi:hypothetical protein